MSEKIKCAVIGAGPVGMELLELLQRSDQLEPVWMVGGEQEIDGLIRAKESGLNVSHDGIPALIPYVVEDRVQIAFETTCKRTPAAQEAWRRLNALGVLTITLSSPLAGQPCAPAANVPNLMWQGVQNLNLLSNSAQVVTPLVRAISRVQVVHYAETVTTLPPGYELAKRESMVDFSEAISEALIRVGKAKHSDAIVLSSPIQSSADMWNTITCQVAAEPDRERILASVLAMLEEMQQHIPGCRLVAGPLFDGRRVITLVAVEASALKRVSSAAAVWTAELCVDKIRSVRRLCSDYDVLPT